MDLATTLSLITTSCFILSMVFAGVNIRLSNMQRSRESALNIMHSFQTTAFVQGLDIMLNTPAGLSKQELEQRLGEKITAVHTMFLTFESLGIMLHRHQVSLQLIDDFFGGPILVSWQKFNRFVTDSRTEMKRDTFGEWFQWLAEQLQEREMKMPGEPAHIAYKHWKE